MKNPLCIVSIFTILDSLETDNVLASLPLAYYLTFRRLSQILVFFKLERVPKTLLRDMFMLYYRRMILFYCYLNSLERAK